MKLSKLVCTVCVLVFIFAVGCKNEAPAPASQAQSAADSVPAGNTLSGKVVETMNSGGYTYVSLENSGKKTWIAVPETKVKVGQMVTCQLGNEMKNFTSKTLNRTFESIIFTDGIR